MEFEFCLAFSMKLILDTKLSKYIVLVNLTRILDAKIRKKNPTDFDLEKIVLNQK